VVTTIEVSPGTVTAMIGDTTRLAATVKDQSGRTMAGRTVSWSSSAEAVATVSTSGLVTGLSVGTATITASLDSKSATAQVTIRTPVATVEIAPGSVTLTQTGTARLTATPRASDGAPIAGKTIIWGTENGAVATVSEAGVVTAAAPGQTSVTATVDGQRGAATVTVLQPGDNVEEEAARAVSQTIGLDGGELRATGSNGATYTLTVPAGALRTATQITMTPVAAVQTLPFSVLAGAVDLQPSGLELAKPAVLTIATTAEADTSLRLIGFSYEGDAESLAAVVAGEVSGAIRLSVRRFGAGTSLPVGPAAGPRSTSGFSWGRSGFTAAAASSGSGGIGAAFTTVGGLLSFLSTSGPTNNSQTYINQLVSLGQDPLTNVAALFDVMRRWMANVIVPLFQNADTDIRLFFALAEYNWWLQTDVAGLVKGTAISLQPERDAAAQAALPRIKQAIAGNNQICLADDDLDAAAGALYWQTVAEDLGLGTTANQLDRATVLSQLCVQIIFTVLTYPDPALPGTGHPLDVRAAIKFGTDPSVADRTVAWRVDVQGSTADGTTLGVSDPFGRFSQAINPRGNQALVIFVEACLFVPEVPYADVCARQTLSPQLVPLLEWHFTDDFEGWSGSGNVITRGAGGRRVLRFAGAPLGSGANVASIGRTLTVPATASTFEMELSAHDRATAKTRVRVRVQGQQGSATIYDAIHTGVEGAFTWSVVTGSLTVFAGQSVTIIVEAGDVTGEHGQMYLDRIRIH
jgi:hypothetical protein